MPHYKDGTPAEVGDFVKGKPYNTDHDIVGTVIQITEGTDTCNCVVAFAEIFCPCPLAFSDFEKVGVKPPLYLTRPTGGRVTQGAGYAPLEQVVILPRFDYGELKAFEKV